MKRFTSYLRDYRLFIGLVIVLTFFDVMIDLYLPNLMSMIVDVGIAQGDTGYILRTGLRMLLVSILATLGMGVSSYFSARAAMGFSRDIRKDVFNHINRFSLDEFNEIGASSLITRTTNDIEQLQRVLMMGLRMMLRAPLMLFGGLFMAISKNKTLSLVLLVAMPILVITISLLGKKSFPLFMVMQDKVDRMNLVLREKLTGVRVIRAFDRNSYEEERFSQANEDLVDNALRVNRMMMSMIPLVNLVLNFTTVGIIWFGAQQVDLGNMFIGDILAFIQYVMLIMFSLIMFSAISVVIPRAMASAERINEVMDLEPSILSQEGAEKIGGIDRLEFQDVGFSYEDSEEKVLDGISFSLERGEVLAIIGGTGSGKTSLINLIPRFFDVVEGSIRVNGRDIRELDEKSLRSHIGYIPQKPVLFSGSIADNIRQGKREASQEEILRALDIAQAGDFVGQLDEGIDSYMAQAGSNYSGGQKQRLSIARALVRRPDLYIFDDSFSALDFKTDRKLREALREEVRDSIFIIVAQRVSTVRDADKILVLDDGQLVGLGSHEELLEESSVYREIIRSQNGQEAI